MPIQRTLRFALNRKNGQLAVNHKADEAALNHPRNLEIKKSYHCPRAALLKRLARRAMADVTECPPDTIPAHLARIDDLREIISYNLRHGYAETPESRFSGKQLETPFTLADYLECLRVTKRQHRAPSFVNQRDEEISQINRKLDCIAGLLSQNPEALDLFQRQFDEAQTAQEEAA